MSLFVCVWKNNGHWSHAGQYLSGPEKTYITLSSILRDIRYSDVSNDNLPPYDIEIKFFKNNYYISVTFNNSVSDTTEYNNYYY